MTSQPQILLVEDNKADADLVREVASGAMAATFHCVADGEEALAFLRKQGIYKNAPDIDLVLLDLNLPKVDGRHVLMEAKSDARLKRIPIIIFTTSEADHDVLAAYDLNANCYIKKPGSLDEFVRVLHMLNSFWLQTAKLPPKNSRGEAYG